MNFKMYVKIQKKSQTTYDSIPYPSIKTNLKLCHKTQYILIFCIKYSFNIVPFRVIQSKLFQGIVIKEVAEFKVKHDMFFCIKYLFRNVSFRKNQLKSCREL